MTETPRPLRHLATAMYRYPDLARLVDDFRAGKGNDLPDWPDWCFVPMSAWAVTVSGRGGKATSEAKASAARANGRKGGRPPRKLHRPVVSAEEWQLFQEWKAGR